MKRTVKQQFDEFDNVVREAKKALDRAKEKRNLFVQAYCFKRFYKRFGDEAEYQLDAERWGCSKSPFGLCVYDEHADPCHDFCVFCGEPEERK